MTRTAITRNRLQTILEQERQFNPKLTISEVEARVLEVGWENIGWDTFRSKNGNTSQN